MEMNASSVDVCRLCAESYDSRSFIPLYTDDKSERNVARQINKLFVNLVSPDDGLPQQICLKCSKNVEMCYSFISNVIETQNRLKRLKQVADQNMKRAAMNEGLMENNRSQAEKVGYTGEETLTVATSSLTTTFADDEERTAVDDFIELLVVDPDEMVEVDVNGILDNTSQNFVSVAGEEGENDDLPMKVEQEQAQELHLGLEACAGEQDQKQARNSPQKAEIAALMSNLANAGDESLAGQTLLLMENVTSSADVKQEPEEITYANNYCGTDDEIVELPEQHVAWMCDDTRAAAGSVEDDEEIVDQDEMDGGIGGEEECNIVYKCGSCANTYANEVLFQSHNCVGAVAVEQDRNGDYDEWSRKNKNVFQCNVCERVFKSKFVFNLHYAQHKKSSTNVCQLCNACFFDSDDLMAHLSRAHCGDGLIVDDNMYEEVIAAVSTTSTAATNATGGRSRDDVDTATFTLLAGDADSEKQCDVCGKITDNLKQHKLYHAIKELEYCKAENKKFLKKWFYCQKCDKKIFSEANYLFHVAKHNGEETVRCRQCDFVAVNIQDYNMHITTHTGGKYFICNDCEKCFFTRSAISDHVLIHMDGTRYMCEICGKRFKTSRSNAQHKLLQHKKYFRCNRCNRGFTHEAKLKSHHNICRVINQDQKDSKVFEPVEKFFCNICNSNIKSSSEISILFHKAKHEGKDGVQCKFCNLLCKNACMYKNHLLIHTNQRPYACTQCPKSFRTKGCLVQHMLVHGDEYKYTCEYCGKKSKKLTTHVNHVNIHTDTKPYKCPDCDRPFRQLSDMKKHRRTHLKYKTESPSQQVAASPASSITTVVTDLPPYLSIKTEVEDMIAAESIQQLQMQLT